MKDAELQEKFEKEVLPKIVEQLKVHMPPISVLNPSLQSTLCTVPPGTLARHSRIP